jgi:hypothetical protein
MRNHVLFFISIILLNASCNQQKKLSGKDLKCPYFAEGIKIDGDLSDWPKGDVVQFKGKDTLHKATVRTGWDGNFFYVAYSIPDNDLRAFQQEQDHKALYLDDMAELLIDAENDKDSCWDEDDIVYHVNLFGVKKDDRGTSECKSDATWNGNASIAVKLNGTLNDSTDTDQGYVVELAIPWTELRLKPEKGLKFGINFAACDNDGKGSQLFDWAGAMPYRSPYAYGNIEMRR